MDLHCAVDRPKELPVTRSGEKVLAFNVYFQSGDAAEALTGFRLMSGRILPPSVKLGNTYVTTVYFSKRKAQSLYETLNATDWAVRYPGVFPLREEAEAIERLVYTDEIITRLFPSPR